MILTLTWVTPFLPPPPAGGRRQTCGGVACARRVLTGLMKGNTLAKTLAYYGGMVKKAEQGRRPWKSPDAEPEYRGSRDPYLWGDHYDDVRAMLADDLGAAVSKRAFDHLVHIWPKGLAAVRDDRDRWMPLLRQKYEISLEDFAPRQSRRRRDLEVPPDVRDQALAHLVAARIERQARLSPLTHEFRERVLGGRLVEPQQIPDWVQSQAMAEGEPSVSVAYMPVPVLNGGRPAWQELLFTPLTRESFAAWLRDLAEVVESCPESELQMPQLVGGEPFELRYCAPGASVLSRPIRYDGVLAALKYAVSGTFGVCQITGWQEHEGVAFVLSGWVPPRPRLALEAYRYPSQLLARGRATIDLDLRVPARELAATYARIREEYIQGADRPMLAKHLELAVFTERLLDEDLTWPQRRTRWNVTVPRKWRYQTKNDPRAKRFALESRRAWARLTGETWPSSRVQQQER